MSECLIQSPLNELPGGETLFGADNPSGIHQRSPTEVVSFPAHKENRDHSQRCRVCFDCPSPHVISCQTDLSLRLTVQGEFPGIPFTIRILVIGTRSSLFPHSLNSTFSVFTKAFIIAKAGRGVLCITCSVIILKLTYWFCQGHFLSSCLKTTTTEMLNCLLEKRSSGSPLHRVYLTQKSEMCTTLFDGTVVKLRFEVCGVAPGSVLIPIWVTTVVLCQIGLRVCSWVYPARSHKSF